MTRSNKPSRLFAWLMLLLGLSATALFGLGLWNSMLYVFHGQSGIGKVIAFHTIGPHSASIVGQVDVSLPGRQPFRAEVDDALGSQSWDIGADILVRCTELRAGDLDCSADSGLWRPLFPLIFVSISLAIVGWSATKLRTR